MALPPIILTGGHAPDRLVKSNSAMQLLITVLLVVPKMSVRAHAIVLDYRSPKLMGCRLTR